MDSESTMQGVVFADITGSTTLFERLGDAEAHSVVSRVLEALDALALQLGGRTVKKIGDEAMCIFPDAASALLFGSSAQRQCRVNTDGRRIELRVGVNFGPVVEGPGGDVFGDTVNVAARLRALASPGQVMTTEDSVAATHVDLPFGTRRLGAHALAGKYREVRVVEVLWDQQLGNLTQMPRGPLAELRGTPLLLRLASGDVSLELSSDARNEEVSMGRDPSNALVVSHDAVSRRHATVAVRGGKFYLKDHSTNGTWVRAGGARAIVVRRESVPLQGSGEISLGADFDAQAGAVIRYEVADAP